MPLLPVSRPQILNVSGCDGSTEDGGTFNCPTGGNQQITIYGQDFPITGPTNILIGGAEVQSVPDFRTVTEDDVYSETRIALPAGTGEAVTVVVVLSLQITPPAALINYAAPAISAIRGCSAGARGCRRTGAERLTIEGSNFGESGAIVFIGLSECLNVTHAESEKHERLYCLTPPVLDDGKAVNVRVLQKNGQLSRTESLIFYAGCPAGEEYNKASPEECVPCQAGSYSSEATNLGAYDCVPCPPGTVVRAEGCQVCPNNAPVIDNQCVCELGFYASNVVSETNFTCQPCPVGASCFDVAGASFESLLPVAGYWRAPDTDMFYPCPGGEDHCQEGGACAPLHTGPLCASCEEGYYMWGGVCTSCDSGAWVVLQLLFFLCSLGYVLFIHTTSQKTTGESSIKVLLYFVSTTRSVRGQHL